MHVFRRLLDEIVLLSRWKPPCTDAVNIDFNGDTGAANIDFNRSHSVSAPDVSNNGSDISSIPTNKLKDLKATMKDSGVFVSTEVNVESYDEPDRSYIMTSRMTHNEVMHVFSEYTKDGEKIYMASVLINILWHFFS